MFNVEEFKRIIKIKESLTVEDKEDPFLMDELWDDLTYLVVESDETLNDFINYMKTDMTWLEYVYLSEISIEIAEARPSYDFIDAYKYLGKKYPKETSKYKIKYFINMTEFVTEMRLGKRKEKKENV